MDSTDTYPNFQYHDGGRARAGYQGRAGDCVTRAVAILTGLPYRGVYQAISARNGLDYRRKGLPKRSARNGVSCNSAWFGRFMRRLGFVHSPVSGKPLLSDFALPGGRLMATVEDHGKRGNKKGHAIAVIDGVFYDTGPPAKQARLVGLYLEAAHAPPPDAESDHDWLHIQCSLFYNDDDTIGMSPAELQARYQADIRHAVAMAKV